jgi:hypothetical protein
MPAIVGLLMAIMPVLGCAPQHRATAERLPASILREDSAIAPPQTAFAKSAPADAASNIRQVDLTEADLRGAPALPDDESRIPATVTTAGPSLEPPGPAPLTSPRASTPQETLLLPQRTQTASQNAPETSDAPDAVSDSPMRRVEAQIESMARQLEAIDPALVGEFLAATRQGVMNDNLDRILTVWQATIDHAQRSSQRIQSVSTASGDPPAETTAPTGLPRRIVSGPETNGPIPGAIRSVEEVNKESTPTAAVASLPNASAHKPIRLTYGGETATVKGDESPEESSPADPSTNSDLELVPTSPREEMQARLLELARSMEGITPVSEEDRIRAQVYSRILYVMAQDNRRALNPIEGTDNIDRKYWRSVVWSMIQYFDEKQLPRPESRAAETVVSLQEAVSTLRQRADLEISTPILCSRVDSFGVYEEFPEYKFAPGQTMVVYWEIRNFSSVETKEGYRTRTSWAFEILDSRGDRRHRLGRDFGDDLCRNQRQDYFNVVKFTLPKDLAPGEYVLKVISTDKTTDKVAERQVRFVIK